MWGRIQISRFRFFYNPLGDKDPSKKGQWVKIEGTWLVTNRHVALPKINDKEIVPDSFTFNLRQTINDEVQWLPITLTKEQFVQRLKVHADNCVDIAVINVNDLIIEKIKEGVPLLNSFTLTSDHLPENNKLSINVGDDILVAGYPRGFYDKKNKFPIVKSGIVSSKWGCSFNDQPLFLIDSKLFPGSSGSVVLTKPKYVAVIEGKMMYNKDGACIFLGIYSGEPVLQYAPIELEGITIIKKESYNLGNVWYSELVPQIIENGLSLT